MTIIEEESLEIEDQGAESRNYEDLDAHGVQEALRDELASDEGEDMQEADENKVTDDAPNEEQGEVQGEASDEQAIEEGSDSSQAGDTDEHVWTANQMADHTRMAEALLFAAVEPLDEKSIADRLPQGADIPAIMELVQAQYQNRGVNLSKIMKKWRFVTAPDVAHVLQKERIEQRKLSRAALETLAIIAYHQPCTRADIEDVRGVAVSRGSLDQLMEIGWVRLRGRRKDVPGRPVLYGTSQEFMEHFGLEGLGDLPGMADLKAAGLLEARLPPNFSVPTPRDQEDDEGDEEQETTEFAQDFHEEEALDDADGDGVDGNEANGDEGNGEHAGENTSESEELNEVVDL